MEIWLMSLGIIFGFFGLIFAIKSSKRLKRKLEMEDPADDDLLDNEDKRLLKQTSIWLGILCLGMVLGLAGNILLFIKNYFF